MVLPKVAEALGSREGVRRLQGEEPGLRGHQTGGLWSQCGCEQVTVSRTGSNSRALGQDSYPGGALEAQGRVLGEFRALLAPVPGAEEGVADTKEELWVSHSMAKRSAGL